VFSSLRNIIRVPDLRNKVLFSLLMLAVYRFGAHVPVPGVDYQAIQSLEDSAKTGGALGFLNLFSGGALTSFAVFALGIMPYITASIIMQILGVVIPKLEEWQNQGAVGQRKITQWTRYVALAIALLQGTALTFLLGKGGRNQFTGQSFAVPLLIDFKLWRVLLVVGTLTVGVALLMWFGELISQRGIGNGMSLLIMASVVSGLPFQGEAVRKEGGNVVFGILLLISLITVVGIVFVEQGQRRIPVQFAKRVVGRRMYGGQSTYIPLKVNQSGVIPIIFASSVLYLPTVVANVSGWQGLQNWVDDWLIRTTSPLHIAFYGLLILAFAYFYTAISFDPVKQADQIRRQGGFIPGIRPGYQTERYLSRILNRITLPGALFIVVIALLPSVILALADVQRVFFAGTTVLIAVGVALETMKQIDSQLMMRNYEGFLK
jgi:preprotein translocase subunit SecY